MKKTVFIILAILVLIETGLPLQAQAPPSSMQAVTYSNITAASTLDGCSPGYPCIDNRSQYTRRSSYYAYRALDNCTSGCSGTWAVDMQYADDTPTSWTSFGPTGQVRQTGPSSGIGYANGPASVSKPYHDFIRFVITGGDASKVVIMNYFGTQQAWWSTTAGSTSYPLTYGYGGTGGTTITNWTSSLDYLASQPTATGSTVQAQLSAFTPLSEFGCQAVDTFDNTACITAALNASVTYGIGILCGNPASTSVPLVYNYSGKIDIEVLAPMKLYGNGQGACILQSTSAASGTSHGIRFYKPNLEVSTSPGRSEINNVMFTACKQKLAVVQFDQVAQFDLIGSAAIPATGHCPDGSGGYTAAFTGTPITNGVLGRAWQVGSEIARDYVNVNGGLASSCSSAVIQCSGIRLEALANNIPWSAGTYTAGQAVYLAAAPTVGYVATTTTSATPPGSGWTALTLTQSGGITPSSTSFSVSSCAFFSVGNYIITFADGMSVRLSSCSGTTATVQADCNITGTTSTDLCYGDEATPVNSESQGAVFIAGFPVATTVTILDNQIYGGNVALNVNYNSEVKVLGDTYIVGSPIGVLETDGSVHLISTHMEQNATDLQMGGLISSVTAFDTAFTAVNLSGTGQALFEGSRLVCCNEVTGKANLTTTSGLTKADWRNGFVSGTNSISIGTTTNMCNNWNEVGDYSPDVNICTIGHGITIQPTATEGSTAPPLAVGYSIYDGLTGNGGGGHSESIIKLNTPVGSPQQISAIQLGQNWYLASIGGAYVNFCSTVDCAGWDGTLQVAVTGGNTVTRIAPTAPTSGTPTSGGSCTAGTHVWAISFVTPSTGAGETTYGATSSSQTCTSGNGTVGLTGIPTGPTGTTARKVYRSKAGSTYPLYYVGTISGNVTTTYSDTAADSSLTTAAVSTPYFISSGPYSWVGSEIVVGGVGVQVTGVSNCADSTDGTICTTLTVPNSSLSNSSDVALTTSFSSLTGANGGTLSPYIISPTTYGNIPGGSTSCSGGTPHVTGVSLSSNGTLTVTCGS